MDASDSIVDLKDKIEDRLGTSVRSLILNDNTILYMRPIHAKDPEAASLPIMDWLKSMDVDHTKCLNLQVSTDDDAADLPPVRVLLPAE